MVWPRESLPHAPQPHFPLQAERRIVGNGANVTATVPILCLACVAIAGRRSPLQKGSTLLFLRAMGISLSRADASVNIARPQFYDYYARNLN
jgi:hypothetical protein